MKIVKHKTIAGLQGKITREISIAERMWAQAVISHASAHAPILTGALRRSLTHSEVEVGLRGYSIKVGPDNTVKDYAPRQELDLSLGFGDLSRSEGATRPWLSPAAKAMEALGRALVKVAFRRALK